MSFKNRKKHIEQLKKEYEDGQLSAWKTYPALSDKEKLDFIEEIVHNVEDRTKFIRLETLKRKTKAVIYKKFFEDCIKDTTEFVEDQTLKETRRIKDGI